MSTAIVVSWILGLSFDPIGWFLYFGGAVLLDGDYLLSKKMSMRNHRLFPTHTPATYLILSPLMLLFHLYPFFLGVAIHLSLDFFDYGLRLNPFSKRLYGLGLVKEPEDPQLSSFLGAYFHNKVVQCSEILLAVAAVALTVSVSL